MRAPWARSGRAQSATRGSVGWGLCRGRYGRTGTAKFCRGGAGARGSGCGASVWVPELGRSPQVQLSMLYAGDTWLEETEETSVLLWDTVEEVSSSPKGFLPQQIVVIMQLRNWGGETNENGGTGGPAGTWNPCRDRDPAPSGKEQSAHGAPRGAAQPQGVSPVCS